MMTSNEQVSSTTTTTINTTDEYISPCAIVKSPINTDILDGKNYEPLTKRSRQSNQKKIKTAKELEEDEKIEIRSKIKSIRRGTHIKINELINFYDTETLYTTEFQNYTLITTGDFTKFIKYAPLDLKKTLHAQWHYGVHVSYGMQPSITEKVLNMRVMGGQILAYKFTECSIEGNECAYYGFIPTQKTDHTLNRLVTHRNCRISSIAIWPRKLYVYLRYVGACKCSDDCAIWSMQTCDGKNYISFCVQKIPWADVYVIMGAENEEYLNRLQEPRMCPVCAQCYECSRKPNFCRKHRICKHKFKHFTLEKDNCMSSTFIKNSSIKSCATFK